MYEKHFGLSKRPFRANAARADVFVGPQTATAMAALKKALVAPDAVVVVSGPVGGGKTTIVNRALESMGDSSVIVSIGRMRLAHDEVLELLLQGLGMHQPPPGTVRRFTSFRRQLQDLAQKSTRVFVVVEDAPRIGANILSELEAVTALDAGESNGASIILMGDAGIDELLRDPELARLKQRVRLRQPIQHLCATELLAYLKHCFRLVGAEFDTLFAAGTADTLHQFSGGIPRVANSLVESALTSAAEKNQQQISVEMIERIAADEYGLTNKHSVKEIAKVVAKSDPAPVEPAPSVPEVIEASVDDAIPELIQDTLPDLKILAPNLANPPSSQDAEPSLPVLEEPSSDTAEDEIPEWDRDPTLAQLRPDLEALERAMSVAQGVDSTDADADDADDPPEVVTTITLDRQIEAKVAEATEELKKSKPKPSADQSDKASDEKNASDTAATSTELPVLTPPTVSGKPVVETKEKASDQAEVNSKKEDDEFNAIAARLAKAKTIDDVDDKLAETLFGEEFSMIAAQVVAKAQENASANDDVQPEPDVPAVAVAAPTAEPASAAAVNVEQPVPPSSKLDVSASQRLATVRALNAKTAPAAAPPAPPIAQSQTPAPTASLPQSFEQQINTSMTATLKALKVSQQPVNDDDDDDDDDEGSFLGLFRRS
ncbi:MAG: AAA family ATPase [Proteobacteria bacterium]|nr:AAA family ATPase [Pseudomonadota bacterium]